MKKLREKRGEKKGDFNARNRWSDHLFSQSIKGIQQKTQMAPVQWRAYHEDSGGHPKKTNSAKDYRSEQPIPSSVENDREKIKLIASASV